MAIVLIKQITYQIIMGCKPIIPATYQKDNSDFHKCVQIDIPTTKIMLTPSLDLPIPAINVNDEPQQKQCSGGFRNVQSFIAKKDPFNEINSSYIDNQFRADTVALYKCNGPPKNEDVAVWDKIEWKKIDEVYKKEYVLVKQASPTLVKVGKLGDPILLSIICALASKPCLIESIFNNTIVNKYGAYIISMNINGRDTKTIVDDIIPTIDGVPAFAYAEGNVIWPMILVKAFAKIYGCYADIVPISISEAAYILIGAPTECYSKATTKEAIQNSIQKALSNGEIVTTVTSVPKNGITCNILYRILNIIELDQDNTIVQVKHPWGVCKWTGKWNSNDEHWKDDYKNKAMLASIEEGSFYMDLSDYISIYDTTYISKYRESYNITTAIFSTEFCELTAVKMSVSSDTYGFVYASFMSMHFKEVQKYDLFYVRLAIWKENALHRYELLNSVNFNEGIAYLVNDQPISAGNYIIIIESLHSSGENGSVILNSYTRKSETEFKAIELTANMLKELVIGGCISKIKPCKEISIPNDTKQDIHLYMCMEFGISVGCLYIANNSTKYSIYVKIQFEEPDSIIMLDYNPKEKGLIEEEVAEQCELLIVFRKNPKIKCSQLSYKLWTHLTCYDRLMYLTPQYKLGSLKNKGVDTLIDIYAYRIMNKLIYTIKNGSTSTTLSTLSFSAAKEYVKNDTANITSALLPGKQTDIEFVLLEPECPYIIDMNNVVAEYLSN